MSNINTLIEKLDDDHLEYLENEKEKFEEWILKIDRVNKNNKLEKKLVDDMRKYFLNYYQKDHTTLKYENSFLQQIPLKIKQEVKLKNKKIIKFFYFLFLKS